MKKTLLILLAGILAVAFSACKNEKEETLKQLQAEVESINAECPMQVDEITTWKSFGIEDGNIVYSYTVSSVEGFSDEEFANELSKNIDGLKEQNYTALKEQYNTDADVHTAMSLVKKAEMGIIYRYTMAETGRSIDVVLTPEEVSAL